MILILFFLFLLTSPVYSDGFDTSGDGALNEYYQTTAFAISQYPDNSENENSIVYDQSDTVGMGTDLVVQNYTISSITSLWYMKRNIGVLDRVAGPPETQIDILYLYFNDTKHPVNISKIVVPFSRDTTDMGNLNNLVEHTDFTPVYSSIDVSFDNKIVRKEGILKEYSGLGIVNTNSDGIKLIDTVKISNPLEVSNIQISENEELLNIAISIKNISSEKLNNISFEHGTYLTQFDINSAQEITLEYALPYSENLGYYKITNPNIKTECVIYGSNNYNWLQPNAVTVLAYREDGGWVNGAHVQPPGESFCITRLPYSFTSETLRYEKESQNDILEESEEELVEKEEENEILEEVLGIQITESSILPKTAKLIY